MATIKEIAKECNVSIATVSNILNHKGKVSEETKKMVLDKVEELNYVPNVAAKKLKQRTAKTIGIITEDLTVFNAPEIVDGIDEYLGEYGYNFLLSNLRIYKKYGNDFTYHDEFKSHLEEEIGIMRANQVEGIIYISSHSRNLSGILRQDVSMPVAVVYGFVKDENIPSVVFHDEEAAYMVVNRLLEQKAERVGVIAGERNSLHTSERLLGCQKAMYQKGVLYNPELICYGDWSREFGYMAATKLHRMGVSVFFSMNDNMAMGIYDYAAEKGLTVGEDIRIGGIGSQFGDILRPKLTTVQMPLFEMGRKAGEIILGVIEGEIPLARTVYKIGGLVLNETEGSAGKGACNK